MKKIIKRVFIFFLLFSGLPWLFRSVIQKRRPTVLLFHHLDLSKADEIFEYLVSNYNVIDVRLLLGALKEGSFESLPDRALVVTFDDGRRSNLKLHIERLGVPVINFLSTCDTRLDGEKFISRREIKALSKKFDIQGHTHSHPNLSQCDYETNLAEMLRNKEELEQVLDKEVDIFAYPYGKYSQNSVEAAKEAGFIAAFTVNSGFVDLSDGSYEIRRICIDETPSLTALKVKVSGVWNLFFKKYGRS